MPRKTRSEVQSPESEPRRRSSRLAALPQASPEPKRTPRTPKTPASAEKPERRGRPAGSTKKSVSPKKETRGRKRKVLSEAADEEEPQAKTAKDTEEEGVTEPTQEEPEATGGAGDAVKDATDGAAEEKEEGENGKEEAAETKEEKMETNQDLIKAPAKPVVQATIPAMQNPVVTIVKGQITQASCGSVMVKQPAVTRPATPPKIIEPSPMATSQSLNPTPVTTPPAQPASEAKESPKTSQSPPEAKGEGAPETDTPTPPKETSDVSTSQPTRTEKPQPTPVSVPEPPQIVAVSPPKDAPRPEGTAEVQISISPIHNDPTDGENAQGQTAVDAPQAAVDIPKVAVHSSPHSQAPPASDPKQETVSTGPSNSPTEDGAGSEAAHVDLLFETRQSPSSLSSLQYLTKPEITITPASDAEHSPTPGSSGGAESDFEERVDEKPMEEPTKEQDVPNNNMPAETIDNLKKDAIQHDGMNNGESVTPATVAV